MRRADALTLLPGRWCEVNEAATGPLPTRIRIPRPARVTQSGGGGRRAAGGGRRTTGGGRRAAGDGRRATGGPAVSRTSEPPRARLLHGLYGTMKFQCRALYADASDRRRAAGLRGRKVTAAD